MDDSRVVKFKNKSNILTWATYYECHNSCVQLILTELWQILSEYPTQLHWQALSDSIEYWSSVTKQMLTANCL